VQGADNRSHSLIRQSLSDSTGPNFPGRLQDLKKDATQAAHRGSKVLGNGFWVPVKPEILSNNLRYWLVLPGVGHDCETGV